jgi:hypothetical protein
MLHLHCQRAGAQVSVERHSVAWGDGIVLIELVQPQNHGPLRQQGGREVGRLAVEGQAGGGRLTRAGSCSSQILELCRSDAARHLPRSPEPTSYTPKRQAWALPPPPLPVSQS